MIETILTVGATVAEVVSTAKNFYDAYQVGKVVEGSKNVYSAYKTGKVLLHGELAKRAMQGMLKRVGETEAQVQKINDHLLYAANLEGISWNQPPEGLPLLEPAPSTLEEFARPAQEVWQAHVDGDIQMLASALIALPPNFMQRLSKNGRPREGNDLKNFLTSKTRYVDQTLVLVIFKNHYGDRITPVTRAHLAEIGFGVNEQWKPNRRVLPPAMRCSAEQTQKILGLTPSLPVLPEKPVVKPAPDPVPSDLIHGRYQDHGDGTVTDVVNKLRWKRCCEGQTWDGKTCLGEATKYQWRDLPKPKDGWRVPTMEEAKTLLYCRSTGKWGDSLPVTKDCDWQKLSDSEKYVCGKSVFKTDENPAVDKEVFVNTPLWIWTSTEYAKRSWFAWLVFFGDGHVYNYYKDGGNAVRVVSSSQ